MSLLPYVVHSNPTSHKDILSKLRTFALAQSWTSPEVHSGMGDGYLTSVLWGATGGSPSYDFLSGNHDFLQLKSTGYGSQNMLFRLRAQGAGGDSQHEWFEIAAIDPANQAIDFNISTHPLGQNDWQDGDVDQLSLSPGVIPKVWFFGNSKFIIAVMQMDSYFIQCFYIGTLEIFDPAETQSVFMATSFYYHSTYPKWYQYSNVHNNHIPPWNVWQTCFYHESEAKTMNSKTGISCSQQNSEVWRGHFAKNGRAVMRNNFTGKRVLIKPIFYVKRNTDSVWYPVGEFPIYHIEYQGLTIGQILTYGSEQYICFPNSIQSRKYGFAIRIV